MNYQPAWLRCAQCPAQLPAIKIYLNFLLGSCFIPRGNAIFRIFCGEYFSFFYRKFSAVARYLEYFDLWGAGVVASLLGAGWLDLVLRQNYQNARPIDNLFWNADHSNWSWSPREKIPSRWAAWTQPCPGLENGSPPGRCGTWWTSSSSSSPAHHRHHIITWTSSSSPASLSS